MTKKFTPKAAPAVAQKPAPKAPDRKPFENVPAPGKGRKPFEKVSADDAIFHDTLTVYSCFAHLYDSRQMLRLNGYVLPRNLFDELGILASRILVDLGLAVSPVYASIDLWVHDGLPRQGSVHINPLTAPKTVREYLLLRVHLVDLLEKIARDPVKVEALREMRQRDIDHGVQAATFLRQISDISLTG